MFYDPSVFSPGFFDRIWGHPYCKLPAHHPHTSIHGKSVPHLGQCLSFFAWPNAWPLQLAGADDSNELHIKIINEHESIVADMLSGLLSLNSLGRTLPQCNWLIIIIVAVTWGPTFRGFTGYQGTNSDAEYSHYWTHWCTKGWG